MLFWDILHFLGRLMRVKRYRIQTHFWNLMGVEEEFRVLDQMGI